MHVWGSCEASAQYSPINVFVNLFHSKNSNLSRCFSDLIHTEYRKLHKNNGHSPFFLPPIMRSSIGQCRNIRFRQLYASHVIITSDDNNSTFSSKTAELKMSRINVDATPSRRIDVDMTSFWQQIPTRIPSTTKYDEWNIVFIRCSIRPLTCALRDWILCFIFPVHVN